jgi:regulator of sigma E protease
VVGQVVPGEEAERAGMREGDLVVRANGEEIATWGDWVSFVRARPAQEIDVLVRRDGTERRLSLTPAPRIDEASGAPYGRIGAAPRPFEEPMERYLVTERYGPWDALGEAFAKTYGMTALTLGVFWKMLKLEVSVKNLSGPITIAEFAGRSAESGAARFLQFLAVVSISLGILNLLPIPILDGGHLLYYLLEAVKGGPLSEQSQILGQQLGIALLVGLMGLAFYNDIARLLG